MKELGVKLFEARTALGLSLEDLERRTRIRVEYLKAVEEGNPEKVPGEAYFRAFARTYAREVGLDLDELVGKYEVQQTPELRITERPSLRERRAKARRRRRLRFLAVTVAAAVLAAVGYWLWSKGFLQMLWDR